MQSIGRGEETALLKKHDHDIQYLASGFIPSGIPHDDLVQEGRIAFIQAVRRWEPGHGANVWTFARVRVLGRLSEVARTESRHAIESGGDAFDFPSGDSPEARYAEKEDLAAAEKRAVERLGPVGRDIVRMVAIERLNAEELAERLNVDRATGYRLIERVSP